MRFDVFLAHNSFDKPTVIRLAKRLCNERNLRVWLDEWELIPGRSWQNGMAKGILASRAGAVLIGRDGVGPWQNEEIEALLQLAVRNNRPLIPVLLPGAPREPELPLFLINRQYVDLREGVTKDGLDKLVWGITGVRRHVDDSITTDAEWLTHFLALQRSALLRTPLFFASADYVPSRDFVIPRLLMPITAERRFGDLQSFGEVRSTLRDHSAEKHGIAVIGRPGVGKSFALIDLCLSLQDDQKPSEVVDIPVYLLPQSIQVRSSDTSLLVRATRFYGLPSGGIRKGARLHYFIDGLDEIGGDAAREVLRLAFCDDACVSVVFASRSPFFLRELRSVPDIASQLDTCFEVLTWDAKTTSAYVESFIREAGRDDLVFEANHLLIQNRKLADLFCHPLNCTLFLVMFVCDPSRHWTKISNVYHLFEQFLQLWLDREAARVTDDMTVTDLWRVHEEIAFALYERRGGAFELADLLADTSTLSRKEIAKLEQDPRVRAMLQQRSGGRTVQFVRYAHESIGDFLTARYTIRCLLARSAVIAHRLFNQYSREVSEFIEQGLAELDERPAVAVRDHLVDLYRMCLTRVVVRGDRIPAEPTLEAQLREQLLYYLGRLPLQRAPRVLRDAFQSEEDPLTSRTAAISAIILHDEDTEQEYIRQMTPGSETDLVNRSADLVYYGDVIESPRLFRDDGVSQWDNMRKAILGRLSTNTRYNINLRWFDLRVLYCTLISRNFRGFLKTDLDLLRRTDLTERPELGSELEILCNSCANALKR